ncbi:ferrous iron transport protein A [Anaerococcus sp. AGMB09787]|uniref:FeoA family protein n=1 Tax=Anaerococcus sp. AGMB09787 TaxID=2922869 RepID=UPI001FAFD446|nr:ferrous iron transport protein A [Anaerococcus sp. AGMB09787]
MTLKDIPVGKSAKIKKVGGHGATKRRIMEMGVTRGTTVLVRKKAPLGDPIQLSLRGFELTIRKADAENILVDSL